MAPGAAGSGTILVEGCKDATTGELVRGTYLRHSENHGHAVYRKSVQVRGFDVLIYYWDARDGPNFCGWWFGPEVGGDLVWAYNPAGAPMPPSAGWQVPYMGPIDNTLQIKPSDAGGAGVGGAATVRPSSAAPQAHAAVRPTPSVGPRGPAVVLPPSAGPQADAGRWAGRPMQASWPKQPSAAAISRSQPAAMNNRQLEELKNRRAEEEKTRRAAQEQRQREQAASMALMKIIQKVHAATPENFEALKKEVDDAIQRDLHKCGEHGEKVTQAASRQIEQARKKIEDARRHRQRLEIQRQKDQADKDAAAQGAPLAIELPPEGVHNVMSRGGAAMKRLADLTGCSIQQEQRTTKSWGGGPTVLRLQGGTKQRRLAAEAIYDLIEGRDWEDVEAGAKGALVLPHDLDLGAYDTATWLTWRLGPVELVFGVRAELGRVALRFWARDEGAPALAEAPPQGLSAAVEAAISEARACTSLTVDANPEKTPEGTEFEPLVGPLMDRYGVIVRQLAPRPARLPANAPEGTVPEDIVPVHVFGPPEAVRDAAGVLWECLVPGQLTDLVLQPMGKIQAVPNLMAAELNNDLKELEAEYKVGVNKADTMLWITGSNPESVESAKRMLQEMLVFYLPETFAWVQGLDGATIAKLREDQNLSVLSARPDCIVVLDAAGGNRGSAWICGAPDVRAEVREIIDGVAPPKADGGASSDAAGTEAAPPGPGAANGESRPETAKPPS